MLTYELQNVSEGIFQSQILEIFLGGHAPRPPKLVVTPPPPIKTLDLPLKEAMKGDAIALGLATHLSNPTFVAILLLMSDVLTLLANLSRLLHVSALNLIYVEGHVQDTVHALEILKDNPFESSYMSVLQDTLDSVEAGDSLEKQHLKKVAHDYISLSTLVTKLHKRFPQVHLLSLLRYFDLCNVYKAELMSMLEVGDILGVDGHQLWLEFTTFYHSFIE